MNAISKNKRQLILTSVVILLALSVWWIRLYAPLQARIEESANDLKLLSEKRGQLELRLEKLRSKSESSKTEDVLSRFSEMRVDGLGPEEVNANTQMLIQAFIQEHAISMKTYKELSPSKWRRHQLCRIHFQFNTTIQELSDLLEYFENLPKVIRVENLTVNYRRSRDATLAVSLRLATLFVETVE